MIPRAVAAALLVFLAAIPARSDVGFGPITVDDATVLPAGVTEFRVGGSFAADAERSERRFDYIRTPLDVRYGWRDDLEIGLSASYDALGGPDELDDAAGFGDPYVRLKYLLAPVTTRATGLAVEGEFGLSVDQSIGTGREAYGIRAVATTHFRHGLGHVEVGYLARGGARDLFRWGVAYDRPFGLLGERTRVVGEVYGGRGEVLGVEDDIVAQAGLKGRIDETWDWHVAGGAGIGGGAPEYIVRLGTTKEFGERAGTGEAAPGEYAGPPPWAPLQKVHEGTEALRADDPARAVILLKEALDADPGLVAAWNNLGVALARLGRASEAKRAFEEALERGGEDADILTNLGFALYEAGDYAGARIALARAAALDPARGDVRAAVAALAPPRSDVSRSAAP